MIPQLPGEFYSEVVLVNDSGVAIVFSVDESFNGELVLYNYNNGKMAPLDFGPDIPFASDLTMNNQGIIAGITFIGGLGSRS